MLVEDGSLVGLDQGDQLAEHLGDVGSIDLVDEECIALARVRMGFVADLLELAVHRTELGGPILCGRNWPDAANEILVGERRVKGHHLVALHRLRGRLRAGVQELPQLG